MKRFLVLLLMLTFGFSCKKSDGVLNQINTPSTTSQTQDSISTLVQNLNTKGSHLRDVANFKEALDTHFEALRIAEKNHDTTGIVFALNNIGTDLRRTSSNIEASKYHFNALEIIGENDKLQKSKAVAMNGLGNIFLSLEKPIEAENYFRQSLNIEQALKSDLGQAINYANIGEAKKMIKSYDQALFYFQKSLAHNEIINSDIGRAICKKSIGEILLLKGQNNDGLNLIRESISLLNDSQDSYHVLEMQVAFSKELLKFKQYKEAKTILNEIVDRASQIQSYEHLYRSYELLTDWYKAQNEFNKALESKEKAILYKDSLTLRNNEVKILEIENRYKNEQAQQKISFLTKENELVEESRTNQQRIFILLVLFLLFLLGSLYFLARKRKQINNQLKDINALKSRFFSNVSHEFRTPITLIQGPLEKMLNANISEDFKREAEMMHRNSKRLLSLVDHILSLSKIEAGKFEIKVTQGNLSQFMEDLSQTFEYQVLDKNLKYHIDLKNSDQVWFDPDIIEMIISNLLSNAFKFTPENGTIKVIGKVENDHYRLKVENSATEEQLNQIDHFFKRFFTSNPSGEGTGIGLSLVKELCKLYGCNIHVGIGDNNQIVFDTKIPMLATQFKPSEINEQKTIIESSINTQNNTSEVQDNLHSVQEKAIMLIVEDNEDMRTYIKSIFENDYIIEEASNGAQGITKAKTIIPDIIISDIMMPKVDGMALCEQLKSDPITDHIPIILLTALTEEDMILQGLACNTDDYITKPFSYKILKAKVANLISIRAKLIEKYRETIIQEPSSIVYNLQETPFSRTIKNVIEDKITNPEFGVEEFADFAAMSRSQLHRKLTATTGMSATEFIRFHRLKIAKEMLKDPLANISEVCYASGFNTPSYFSKQFKTLFGITPQDYKNQRQ